MYNLKSPLLNIVACAYDLLHALQRAFVRNNRETTVENNITVFIVKNKK